MTDHSADTLSAALRVLVIDPPSGRGADGLHARIDRFVQLYLSQHWDAPRRFVRVRDLAYVLYDESDPGGLKDRTEDVRAALEQRLFGDHGDANVKVYGLIGEAGPLQAFMAESDATIQRTREPSLSRGPAADDANAGPDGAAGRAPNHAERPFTPVYCGVYDLEKEILLASILAARPRIGDSASGPMHVAAARLKAAPADLDAALFDVASADAAHAGAHAVVLVPIHFDSLAAAGSRRMLQERFEAAPPDVLKRLGAQVHGAPTSPSHDTLVQIVESLRPHFRLINWVVRQGAVDVDRYRDARVPMLSLAAQPDGGDPAIERARFLAKAASMRNAGILPGIDGVRDAEQIKRCREARVRYVSGAAVAPYRDQPYPAMKVCARDLPCAA